MSETADAWAGGSGDRRSLGPETWIWGGATLAVAIAFGWLGSLGWPGEPNGCLTRFVCFCEAVQPGVARQPWNTWSNLPAIALAGWVSWQVSAIRGDAARQADERLMRVAGVGRVFAAMLWCHEAGLSHVSTEPEHSAALRCAPLDAARTCMSRMAPPSWRRHKPRASDGDLSSRRICNSRDRRRCFSHPRCATIAQNR